MQFFLCLFLIPVLWSQCPSQRQYTVDVPSEFNHEKVYPGLSTADSGFQICDLNSKTQHKVIVLRSEFELHWYQNDTLKEVIPISNGSGDAFDKTREGDATTPLGVFYVTHRNPNSSFHLSLGISYPTPEDASRGLKSGLIDLQEFAAIRKAHKEGRQPPQTTELGSWIMLHGEPNWAPTFAPIWLKRRLLTARNWTQGCVSMINEDIKRIYDALDPGSTVVILP